MAIDTGKILNVDVKDYLNSRSKLSSQYDLVGVHCHKETISDFAALVPNNAEVVVKYQHIFFGAGAGGSYLFLHHQIGTALVPKE